MTSDEQRTFRVWIVTDGELIEHITTNEAQAAGFARSSNDLARRGDPQARVEERLAMLLAADVSSRADN